MPEAPEAGREVTRARKSPPRIIVGVDGEGMTDGPNRAHRYFMMGASTEDGEEHSIDNLTRLSTVDCLEFLLRFAGRRHLVMSYAFGYDITKIVEDLPDRDVYLLMRPELRKHLAVRAPGAKPPRQSLTPVLWNGYALNLQGTRFEVSHGEGRKKRRTVVWDLFRFFQTSFVGALTAWNIGTPALRERMAAMKKNRPTFERSQLMQIRAYCLEECACMVDLARALIDAHEDAGIPLRKFYGAGSSGEAMLHALGVAPREHAPIPEGMREGLARAFFGGRFEVGRLGIVR